MFPAYTYMDPHKQPFPHPSNHNPYPYFHYPNWEQMPSQMRVDSSKPPSSFGPWSYYATNDHPNPTECSGCGNHSYPPGYYSFRPPYPAYPPYHHPPSQFYYHGPYPPYHDSYPPYFVPPPHYSAGQPRYDHEKAGGHCCGCPNHTCPKPAIKGVQIEEHEPETEQQDSGPSRVARLPNYPYPVVWVPSDFTKDKESNKDSELQPVSWNGWVPLDVNSLRSPRQGGDGKRSPQKSEEGRTQFPWPAIWMPDQSKPKELVKEFKQANANPRAAEEFPKFKIIPLKFLENENREEKPQVVEDATRPRVVEEEPKTEAQSDAVAPKESKSRTIPVKRMGEIKEKKFGLDEKVKEMGETKPSFPEKPNKENGTKKSSDGKQSPVKSSKLPPVCLRIDPLPRRKNGNGSSRSPNPPSLKEEARAHQESKEQEPHVEEAKAEIPKKEIKVVKVKDGSSIQRQKEEGQSRDTALVAPVKDSSGNTAAKKSSEVEGKQMTRESLDKEEANEGGQKLEDNKGVTKGDMEGAEGKMKEEKKVRKILSPEDAALLIQSAYKGYDVRRWQPLEKLRKIARVREQVEGIKRQIQSLEASPKELDAKQKMVISETIMSLLLQLDTIQGLHQSVREARKIVAKELISLQEKLDILSRQATTECAAPEVEESTDSVSDNQAARGESSSTATKIASEATYEQPSVDKCIVESESIMRKAEVDAEERSHDDSATPNEAEKPAEMLKDVVVSVADEECKDARLLREEQPDAEAGALAESKLINEKTSDEPRESIEPSVCKDEEAFVSLVEKVVEEPLVSSVKEELEGPLGSKDGVPHSGLEEYQQNKGVSSTVFEGVKEETSDSGAGHDTKVNLEDTVVETSGKAELESIANESIKDQVGGEELVVEIKEPLTQSSEMDTKQSKSVADGILKSEIARSDGADTKQEDAAEGNTVKSDMLYPDSTAPGSSIAECDGADAGMIMEKNVEVHEGLADHASVNNPVLESQDEILGASVNNPVPESQDQVLGLTQQPSKQKPTSGSVPADNSEFEEKCSASETDFEATVDATPVAKGGEAAVLNCDEIISPVPAVEATHEEAGLPAPKEGGSDIADHGDLDQATKQAPSKDLSKEEKKLVEENEKLREMIEKLLMAGKEQLGLISDLKGRVKDLERKLAQNKRVRIKRHKPTRSSPIVAS